MPTTRTDLASVHETRTASQVTLCTQCTVISAVHTKAALAHSAAHFVHQCNWCSALDATHFRIKGADQRHAQKM